LKLISIKSRLDGFTLVEVLVTMAIASISLAAIYSVFGSSQKINTSNEVTARIMQDLRLSLDLMESDIRVAGLKSPASTGSERIEKATSAEITFTADRNMKDGIDVANLTDGFQDNDFERITYLYDSGTKRLLQYLSDANEEAIAENVENFNFSYFDESNAVTADTSAIRTVEVTMTIQQPSGTSGNISRTMTRRIFCRNLAM